MATLNEQYLYIGDNGRVFCGALRCAGQSAHFSGHCISGQRAQRVTAADTKEWIALMGSAPKCESCGKEQGLVVLSAGVAL